MSTERDELVDEIAGHPIGSGYYSTSVGTDEAGEIADAILAAGYRKPQQVTTVEELDALPEGSVILSMQTGNSAQKDGEGYWYLWGGDIGLTSEEIDVPTMVLHVGGAE